MESRHVSYILTVSWLCFLWGCQSLPETPEDLAAYARDPEHGLVQSKQFGGVNMQVQYRPTDLLVNQELQDDRSAEKVATLREKYDRYAYFILSFSQDGKSPLYQQTSHGQFSEILQNLAFRMDQFAQVITAQQDTVPLLDSAFPRLYGHGSSTPVMLVFDKAKLPDRGKIRLAVADVGLGTGRQEFVFDAPKLHQAPQVFE